MASAILALIIIAACVSTALASALISRRREFASSRIQQALTKNDSVMKVQANSATAIQSPSTAIEKLNANITIKNFDTAFQPLAVSSAKKDENAQIRLRDITETTVETVEDSIAKGASSANFRRRNRRRVDKKNKGKNKR